MFSPKKENQAYNAVQDARDVTVQQQRPMCLIPTNLEPVNDEHNNPVPNLYKQKDDAKYFWRNPSTGELTELKHQSNGMLRIMGASLRAVENSRVRTIALITTLLIFMIGYNAKVENNGEPIEFQLSNLNKVLQNVTLPNNYSPTASSVIGRARTGAIETRHTMTILSIILFLSGLAGTLRRSAISVSENSSALTSHGGYMALAVLFGVGGLGMGIAASINSLISPNNTFNYLWFNRIIQNETLLPLLYLAFATICGFAFEGVCYFAGISHKNEAVQTAGVYNNAIGAAKAAWHQAQDAARLGWAGAANTIWGGSPSDLARRYNTAYDNRAIDAADKETAANQAPILQ